MEWNAFRVGHAESVESDFAIFDNIFMTKIPFWNGHRPRLGSLARKKRAHRFRFCQLEVLNSEFNVQSTHIEQISCAPAHNSSWSVLLSGWLQGWIWYDYGDRGKNATDSCSWAVLNTNYYTFYTIKITSWVLWFKRISPEARRHWIVWGFP